jgi:hypothetical protein
MRLVDLMKSGPRTICLDIESAAGVGFQINGNPLVSRPHEALTLIPCSSGWKPTASGLAAAPTIRL